MSILNDCRRYSSNEEEYEEWKSEMEDEYRRQENYDRQMEERRMAEADEQGMDEE